MTVATTGTSRKKVPIHGGGTACVRFNLTCPAPAGDTTACNCANPDFRPK